MEFTINAPAKINLYLDILNKRNDGYHEVEMIMQTVSLFDKITIKKSDKKGIILTSTYDFDGDVKKNTAYIAAEKFFEYTKLINTGTCIHIQKQIPIGAGLAGGSSDAAAVLIALNTLFECSLSKGELAAIGKKVGADVPFCIFGGTMLATGTGTTLSHLPPLPGCYILIVKPIFSVSTKLAYQASDKTPREENKSINNIISAIKSNNLRDTAKDVYNRFEFVLNFDEVTNIKNVLNKNGALNSCMTGTGSAVYGIFEDKDKAIYCKKILSKSYKDIFLVIPFFYNKNNIEGKGNASLHYS